MNSINEKEQFKKDLFNKSITKWYNILLKIETSSFENHLKIILKILSS